MRKIFTMISVIVVLQVFNFPLFAQSQALITCPANKIVSTDPVSCMATVYNIDPVFAPAGAQVAYHITSHRYDHNGGNTYGGGYFNSPAGALRSNPTATGKASYGFAMNYFKNSTNPKGETQFEFKVGEFEFNALNFDYLVINNSMANLKAQEK